MAFVCLLCAAWYSIAQPSKWLIVVVWLGMQREIILSEKRRRWCLVADGYLLDGTWSGAEFRLSTVEYRIRTRANLWLMLLMKTHTMHSPASYLPFYSHDNTWRKLDCIRHIFGLGASWINSTHPVITLTLKCQIITGEEEQAPIRSRYVRYQRLGRRWPWLKQQTTTPKSPCGPAEDKWLSGVTDKWIRLHWQAE